MILCVIKRPIFKDCRSSLNLYVCQKSDRAVLFPSSCKKSRYGDEHFTQSLLVEPGGGTIWLHMYIWPHLLSLKDYLEETGD